MAVDVTNCDDDGILIMVILSGVCDCGVCWYFVMALLMNYKYTLQITCAMLILRYIYRDDDHLKVVFLQRKLFFTGVDVRSGVLLVEHFYLIK